MLARDVAPAVLDYLITGHRLVLPGERLFARTTGHAPHFGRNAEQFGLVPGEASDPQEFIKKNKTQLSELEARIPEWTYVIADAVAAGGFKVVRGCWWGPKSTTARSAA